MLTYVDVAHIQYVSNANKLQVVKQKITLGLYQPCQLVCYLFIVQVFKLFKQLLIKIHFTMTTLRYICISIQHFSFFQELLHHH